MLPGGLAPEGLDRYETCRQAVSWVPAMQPQVGVGAFNREKAGARALHCVIFFVGREREPSAGEGTLGSPRPAEPPAEYSRKRNTWVWPE